MRLLPESRRGRASLAAGLAGLVALGAYLVLDEYRPWEQPRYRGRPGSWWAEEYEGVIWAHDYAAPWMTPFLRSPAWSDEWLGRVGIRLPDRPLDGRLLQGDPGAVPVLVELLRSRHIHTRRAAAYG